MIYWMSLQKKGLETTNFPDCIVLKMDFEFLYYRGCGIPLLARFVVAFGSSLTLTCSEISLTYVNKHTHD